MTTDELIELIFAVAHKLKAWVGMHPDYNRVSHCYVNYNGDTYHVHSLPDQPDRIGIYRIKANDRESLVMVLGDFEEV